MDKPYHPSEAQSLLKVAVSDKRQKEIKQTFLKLLPLRHWPAFYSACAKAYEVRAAQSANSVKSTREDIEKMIKKSSDIRHLVVQAGPLTEYHLPHDILHKIDDLIASFSDAKKSAETINSTKPSKAYRDELAFELIRLMEIEGVPVKLSRAYSTKGKSDTFYRLMELAVEMAEGSSPSNLRTHMTKAKKIRDSIKKRKMAKIPRK